MLVEGGGLVDRVGGGEGGGAGDKSEGKEKLHDEIVLGVDVVDILERI